MVRNETGQAGGTSWSLKDIERLRLAEAMRQSPDRQCAPWDQSPLGGSSKVPSWGVTQGTSQQVS